MRQIINVLLRLPKWYGLTILLIYSVMIAEFVKVLNTLFMVGGIEKVALMEKIVQLNYGLTIVSSIIVWILICLLFHLMALLFDGKTTFGSFLIVAAYPYFIPAVILLFAVLLLDGISIKDSVDIMQLILQNDSYKIVIKALNYSFVFYYLLVACIIHYLYNLKWLYALLSVAIPVVSIYAVTELFKLVM